MPPTFWEQHGTNIVIAGIALAMLAGSVLWRICRPKPPLIVAPDIEASAALVKWLGQPEDGNCLSNTSQILRRYVVRAFGLPAGEYTTAEFCCELEKSEKIAPELKPAISDFLRECDKRKFSPAGSPASINAVSRALALIEQAEKQRALVGQVSSRDDDGSSAASPHQISVK